MLIVGERINATRKSMGEALAKKDIRFIQNEAVKQVESGAAYIDVNCGNPDHEQEVRDMEWVVKAVQEAVKVPLCIDSANPKALEKGLSVHKGKALVNSVTAEKDRMKEVLPIVKRFNAGIIALTNDETGMPRTCGERFDLARRILDESNRLGIKDEDVYFDPLVRPVSAEQDQPIEFLNALRSIKTLGNVHTICGLSNVSFGLPNRKVMNAVFMAMALSYGLNAAIIDPLDKLMMATIKAAEALLGYDEYCGKYIESARKGELDF